MKRFLALLLTLVLMLTTFSGCIKKRTARKQKDDTASYELLYAPVLKKYKQGLDESWTAEKYLSAGLSPKLASADKSAAPAFTFLDLDGDKTPELFIGRADSSAEVLDLYTLDGDVIRQLTDPAAEGVMTLTEDDRLVESRTEYEHLDVTTYYTLQAGELTEAQHYIYDPQKMIDGTDDCFVSTGPLPDDEQEIYADTLEVISKEDYDRAAKDFERASPEMKPFDDLTLPEDPADETAVLSPEDAVAIYLEHRDVWKSDLPDTAMWSASYSVIFLDLDFDGVLELVRNEYSGGSGLIDYNYYFRIDPETQTVVRMSEHHGDTLSTEIDEGPGYEFYMPNAGDPDAEPTPVLYSEKKTGEKRYFFHGTERDGVYANWTFYGDLYMENEAVAANALFAEVYHDTSVFEGDEWTYYLGEDSQPVSESAYENARADYFAARDDLHLQWAQVWNTDIEGADDDALRSLLLNSYRAFGYDGYEPAGDGQTIQRYIPPLKDEDALAIYKSNTAVFGNTSDGGSGLCFIDLDLDGVMEVRKIVKDWSSNATDNTYYKIDRAANRVVKVPANGPATTFDRFHRTLRHKTDGSVRLFCEDLDKVGDDLYERRLGTLELTDGTITSELLFAKRYRIQTRNDDSFYQPGYLTIPETHYYVYENGTKTEVSAADYEARMAAFFDSYEPYTVENEQTYLYFGNDQDDEDNLNAYRCAKAQKMTSLALTEAPTIPAEDRSSFLPLEADEEQKLSLYSYIYGGDPIVGKALPQNATDLLNYDYRDADAAEKAYRHLSFGLFGHLNLGTTFVNEFYVEGGLEEQHVKYEEFPSSAWQTRVSGTTPESYSSYSTYFSKTGEAFFDAVLRAGYNVAPDHNYIFENVSYDGAYRQKIAFYQGGSYYVISADAGDVIVDASCVTDVKHNADGTYTFRYHCADGTMDDWDNFTGFREISVTEFEITLAIKEVYGERVWSFYQIKEVF